MKVRITYSDKRLDEKNLYKIFSDIIKKDMEKNNKDKRGDKEGGENEKNGSAIES